MYHKKFLISFVHKINHALFIVMLIRVDGSELIKKIALNIFCLTQERDLFL